MMPSAASCSISGAAQKSAGTSVKSVPVGGGGTKSGPCLARTRKTAISARVVVASGQYIGVAGMQPRVRRAW